MPMRKYIWIGLRDTVNVDQPYEINLTKKDWDPSEGWDEPVLNLCQYDMENEIGIYLNPGEVAKLELKLIRK